MGKRKAPKSSAKGAGLVEQPVDSKCMKKDVPTDVQDEVIPQVPDTVVPHDRLKKDFFSQSCTDLSKSLLGKYLARKLDSGEVLKGMIVETEAYLGGTDKGAHSYNGKRTAKNEAMYMDPGTSYVYHIYGLYTCMNISSKGEGAAVLIRALDPICGMSEMKKYRGAKRADKGENLKEKELGSGPSKLTQALSISKALGDQKELCTYEHIWVEEGEDVDPSDIVSCARIGIDYAEEWAKKPLRFYVKGNKSVSVRDKAAEACAPAEVDEHPETTHTTEASESVKAADTTDTPVNTVVLQSECANSSAKSKSKVDKTSGRRHRQGGPKGKSDCSKRNNHSKHMYSPPVEAIDYVQCLKHNTSACVTETFCDFSRTLQYTSHSGYNCLSHQRLLREFYTQPGLNLANNLLGKALVRKIDSTNILKGIIVETEAYLGTVDGCCHSFSGKPTPKTAAMFMTPGTAYVYHVYYNYYCFNISSSGNGAVVLIRALMPITGHNIMKSRRGQIRKDHETSLKDHQLCNGPFKLCMAMDILKQVEFR